MKKLVIVFIIISYITLAATVYYLFQQNQNAARLIASTPTVPPAPVKKTVLLPADAVKISECVPLMGEHWVRPVDVPRGPYYVVYQDKVVALEYMIKPEELPGEKVARMSFPEFLKHMKDNNLTLKDIVENDSVEFKLDGSEYYSVFADWTPPHAGIIVPHIDVHAYLVTDEFRKTICPDVTLDQVESPDVVKTIKENNIPYPGP